MIKVLFFARKSREEVWEYDFIVNEILPKNLNKSFHFLSLDEVRETQEIFDVFVYSCRDPQNYHWGYVPTYEEVLECILKTKPKIIIQLSDEFLHENLDHHNNLGNYCDLFLRQHHHPNYSYTANTLHIPLGYYNNFNVSNKSIPKVKNRNLNWCFVGYKKADREECINKFSIIDKSFVSLLNEGESPNVSKEELNDLYLNSIFSPATRGWTNLYPNRLFEASICGSIPIVVGSDQEILDTFKYEENPPWIFSETWDSAAEICRDMLQDLEELQRIQDSILFWWKNRMNNIKEKIIKVFKDKKIIEHYYQDDNIFGENWFGYPNLYKSVVKKFPSGSKFVEVGCWRGRSSSFLAVEIANSEKQIDFYCVDTWEGSVEHKNQDLSELYDTFIENMKPVEKYYFPLKISSLEASKKFKDCSLDFVFLDGSHEYEDVKLDIEHWLPKVKPGGILSGHDYYVDGYDYFPGVKRAVNEILSDFDTKEGCWIYEVPLKKSVEEKLKNFPSVNFISIEDSHDRRKLLYDNFEKYAIKNVTPHIYKKYSGDDNKIIEGSLELNFSARGPVTSHLKAIKEWYENTDEPYTLFCEDDLSFDSVEYWNFTWNEFFLSLPNNWDCVQLCLVRQDMFAYYYPDTDFKLRHRCFDDWSACVYLITRKHAENLIKNYYSNDSIHLEYKGTDREYRVSLENAYWFLLPHAENLIYSCFDDAKIYSFPLFLENVNDFISTRPEPHLSYPNVISYNQVIEWWKTKGKNIKLSRFLLEQ